MAIELIAGNVGREVLLPGGRVTGRLLGWTGDRKFLFVEVTRKVNGRPVRQRERVAAFGVRLKPQQSPTGGD